MKVFIDKLDELSHEARQKILTYSLSNFDKMEFIFKKKNVNDSSFSIKERKVLIDMAISKLMESTKVDFLKEKIKLKDGETKLFHALSYSIEKGDKKLEDTTDEVLDINKRFIDYIKIKTQVSDKQKKEMNDSYNEMVKLFETKSYDMTKEQKGKDVEMVDYVKVVNNNTVVNVNKKTGMIKQIFFSLTMATIVKKIFKFKGY